VAAIVWAPSGRAISKSAFLMSGVSKPISRTIGPLAGASMVKLPSLADSAVASEPRTPMSIADRSVRVQTSKNRRSVSRQSVPEIARAAPPSTPASWSPPPPPPPPTPPPPGRDGARSLVSVQPKAQIRAAMAIEALPLRGGGRRGVPMAAMPKL
jgi:hypothetical protein